MARVPQSWRPATKVSTPTYRRGHQTKRSQPFWVQLPDIHRTELLFVEDKMLDGLILPPLAITPRLNMRSPSATTKIPLAYAHRQLQFNSPFTISSNAFRTQGWSNLGRDDVSRLRKTLPKVRTLVCWLVGYPSHWTD
jgi:hypothetical protein